MLGNERDRQLRRDPKREIVAAIVNWKTDSPRRIFGACQNLVIRSCKCGAVYDRSEHITEAREISSFECAVCGATIENWNSAWVPRYRFIARPARDAE